ncbi:MAG: transketolase [Chloroflexi bacterium]|nr:transketolase [Chloroflexota bacterium]
MSTLQEGVTSQTLDELAINTIRTLAMDAVQKADSGHPGLPMGAAAMAYVLWTRFLKHNPRNPAWPNRDRFILSAGHGSMLLYSLLYLTGYDLPLEELTQFRQFGSKTPGHPEYGLTTGVETTTGPLGQGFGNGVGMAMAARHMAATFNRPGFNLMDHYIYAIVSDGDLMEGVASEAASLAGHLKLGNLIYFYDDNHISIEGSTSLTFTENRGMRFEAYNWHVQHVPGNDLEAMSQAIRAAQAETNRPSLIIARTHIGYGSPHKQDTAEAHGTPLGADEIRLTKEALGWPSDAPFFVPPQALEHYRQAIQQGETAEQAWLDLKAAYARQFPELAAEWQRRIDRELPQGWQADLPSFPPSEKGTPTRRASGKILNAIASRLPELFGGSADLAPSTNTLIDNATAFSPEDYAGRNVHFGVREHGMGAALNGMAVYGGLIPYGGTFLIFSDYMRPAIRLAALMELQVIYVFTHDSIGLGEDGPTHQPVEQLAALRAIPHLTVIRPADANETTIAWKVALGHQHGPVALVFSRQSLPVFDRSQMGAVGGLEQGGYILLEAPQSRPELIILSTGSEVELAVGAARQLQEEGVATRVVSMPSWELFNAQPEAYRHTVLPPSVKARLSVEAGVSQGWRQYVGDGGDCISLEHFGASAPYQKLYQAFGFTVDAIVTHARGLLQ